MATTTTSTMGCHCQHKRKLPKLIQTSTKISLVVLAVTRTIGRSSGLRPGVKNARSTNFYSAAMVAWAAVHAGQCQVCKHFLHKDLAVEWVNCLITANGKGRREQLTSLRKKIFEHSTSSAHNSAETILRGKKEKRIEKLVEKCSQWRSDMQKFSYSIPFSQKELTVQRLSELTGITRIERSEFRNWFEVAVQCYWDYKTRVWRDEESSV